MQNSSSDAPVNILEFVVRIYVTSRQLLIDRDATEKTIDACEELSHVLHALADSLTDPIEWAPRALDISGPMMMFVFRLLMCTDRLAHDRDAANDMLTRWRKVHGTGEMMRSGLCMNVLSKMSAEDLNDGARVRQGARAARRCASLLREQLRVCEEQIRTRRSTSGKGRKPDPAIDVLARVIEGTGADVTTVAKMLCAAGLPPPRSRSVEEPDMDVERWKVSLNNHLSRSRKRTGHRSQKRNA